MATETLTIQFQGACIHYWNNTLHGIPHRVVLPDAGPMRVGLLTGPFITNGDDPGNWLEYVLYPHFAFVTMTGVDFTADGIIEDGYLFTNSHLRVVNAIDTGLVYADETSSNPFANVPQLTEYVPQYSPSNDVIMGGGAAAYFDILAGTISSLQPVDSDNIGVQAIIQTDGPPVLRITPMVLTDQPLVTQPFTLHDTSQTLVISNTSPVCPDGCDFDFLANYLTAVGGIPRAFARALPGLNTGNFPDVTESVEKLKKNGYPGKITRWDDFFETSASCSDSRYP